MNQGWAPAAAFSSALACYLAAAAALDRWGPPGLRIADPGKASSTARRRAFARVFPGIGARSIGLERLWPGRAERLKARRSARDVEKRLADLIDLMAACASAGVALPEVFEAAARSRISTGSQVFAALAERMRMGRSPGRALEDLSRSRAYQFLPRALFSLVHCIDQASAMGTPLSGLLKEEADSWRKHMAAVSERRASGVPLKLALCTTLMLLPSAMLVVLAPNIIAFTRGGW